MPSLSTFVAESRHCGCSAIGNPAACRGSTTSSPRACWRDIVNRRTACLLVVLGTASLGLSGCAQFRKDQPRDTVLAARRVEAMQELLARPAGAPLIDRDQTLLVLHEDVIQRLLTAALPFEQDVKGQLVVRLESVTVGFNDAVPLLHLSGTARPSDAPGRPASPPTLTVEIEAAIESIEFEAADGILRARARVLAVESQPTGVKPTGWRGFVSDLARLGARNFEGVNYEIEIPIRVADRLTLPDLASDEKPDLPVQIEPASIPLDVSVGAPVALFHHLWIPVNLLSADRLDSAAARSALTPDQRAPRHPKRRTKQRQAAPSSSLEAALRDSLDRRFRQDAVLPKMVADGARVTVGTSEGLLDALLEQVATHYLDRVEIDLEATIQEEETGALRVDTPVGKIRAGGWSILLEVERLCGVLKAGRPHVDVGQEGLISLRIPTRIESGSGQMRLDFAWKPSKLVSILCHGFRDTVQVDALVLAQDHDLSGEVSFVDTPGGISMRTSIRRDRHPIAMTLTDESWATVRASLATQDRTSRCGMLLDPDDAVLKLKALGAAGIKIRMPERLFPSVTLPTRVSRSVMIFQTPVGIAPGPNRTSSYDRMIWTSAEIELIPSKGVMAPAESGNR